MAVHDGTEKQSASSHARDGVVHRSVTKLSKSHSQKLLPTRQHPNRTLLLP